MLGTGIGAALAAIGAAGTFIYNNWSGISSMFGGIGAGIMAALQPVMPVLQPVADGVGWLADKVASLLGPLSASNAEWRAFGVEIGTAIGGAITSVIQTMQELVAWVVALPGRISAAASGLYEAGSNLLGQLWEGMKAKFAAILDWARAIGARISGAISGAFGGAKAPSTPEAPAAPGKQSFLGGGESFTAYAARLGAYGGPAGGQSRAQLDIKVVADGAKASASWREEGRRLFDEPKLNTMPNMAGPAFG